MVLWVISVIGLGHEGMDNTICGEVHTALRGSQAVGLLRVIEFMGHKQQKGRLFEERKETNKGTRGDQRVWG